VTLDYGASSGEEKVLCSARSGDSFTIVTRGYDGTAATGHSAGAAVRHTISAVDLDEANAHVNDTTRDDHTQYAMRKQGLTVAKGAASRAGKFFYDITTNLLSYDDGTNWHDFQDKTSADGAYGALAWTAYTPSLTGVTIGNGTVGGYYRLVGKTLTLRVYLTFGSTTAFTGSVSVGLPASLALAAGGGEQAVVARLFSGGSAFTGFANGAPSASTLQVEGPSSTTAATFQTIDATHPKTWVTADNFVVQGTLEVA
jgi:hypothetical protein